MSQRGNLGRAGRGFARPAGMKRRASQSLDPPYFSSFIPAGLAKPRPALLFEFHCGGPRKASTRPTFRVSFRRASQSLDPPFHSGGPRKPRPALLFQEHRLFTTYRIMSCMR